LSSVSYAFLNKKFYVGKDDKRQFLERLKEKGIFLLDATYEPINQIKDKKLRCSKIEAAYPELEKSIQNLPLRDDAKVLLIHANVIKAIGQALKEVFSNLGYRFYDICFPRYYNDEMFKERIQEAIED
jgi:hypothetical protein